MSSKSRSQGHLQGEFHIPSLDGIRGLAALTVFVSHAGLGHVVPGGFGVTVFFFLSGYLITTLLRMEHERYGRISFRRFYLRRVYRILPPMYIVLLLVLLLSLGEIIPHRMTMEAVAAQFAHLTNYYGALAGQENLAPGTSVMWSLAVEEHFYLLFPLLVAMLFKRVNHTTTATILLILCAVTLAWRCYLVLIAGVGHDYVYHATDTRMDSLLFGCVLGAWLNPVLDRSRISLSEKSWLALFCGSLGLLLVGFVYRDEAFRETFRYTLQGIALFSLFFCAVRYHHWPIFAWLESRPMRALGLISYTFYLVHVPCLSLLRLYTDMSTPLRGVLGFCATVAVSAAMYFLVERRLGALRRKLHGDTATVMERSTAGIGGAVSTPR